MTDYLGGKRMFNWKEYVNPKCTVNLDLQVDTEKIDKDLETLKQMLTSLAGALHKKLVFVVNENSVEIFRGFED